MKAARIGVMVLGILVLMFVITPYVSAQVYSGVWFKGKASLKGYEVSADKTAIIGKAGGSGTIYVNIKDGANLPEPDPVHYLVTTCLEDPDEKDVWHLGEEFDIWKGFVYGDENINIWDFASSDEGFPFAGPIETYPMFYVKMKGDLEQADFKSFSCQLWDRSEPLIGFQLGSCTISFKPVDYLKVPGGCLPQP